MERFARGNFVARAVDVKPNFMKRGVVNNRTVGTVLQGAVGGDVFVKFDIGAVPNILLAAKLFTDFVQKLPVVLTGKLEAVSPQIEEAGVTACLIGAL